MYQPITPSLPTLTFTPPAPVTLSADGPKPVLKWAGGKRWLAPTLAAMVRSAGDRRLVEPFAGGLGVSLSLRPERALLNDINPHVINLYRHLADGFRPTLRMRLDQAFYYQIRDEFNRLIRTERGRTSRRAAECFYYLNRSGFNGLCRFNSRGEFNVAFGRYKHVEYRSDFSDYQDAFRNWTFTNVDFEQLDVSERDIVYADPPYDTPFTKYSAEDFSWEDQERLVEWLVGLSCPVIISNEATDRIIELYRRNGFKLAILDAPRRISRSGDRTPAKEVLATLRLDTHAPWAYRPKTSTGQCPVRRAGHDRPVRSVSRSAA